MKFGFGGKCDKTIAGHQPLTTADDETMADHQPLTTANDKTTVGGFVSFCCQTQLCHTQLFNKGWRICLFLLSRLLDVARGTDLREGY